LLFVLIAELLQIIINKACSLGLLIKPIDTASEDSPIIHYADKNMLILQADARQIIAQKAILNSFSRSSGLMINFSKPFMLPLNVLDEKLGILAGTFGCAIDSFPFTYLGLPVGITKPKIQDFSPLISKIERRLNSCANFLSYSGRPQVVNLVMTPTIIYTMCTINLPSGVVDEIDRLRKQCL